MDFHSNMCIALETMYVVDVDSADVIANVGDDREDGDSGNPLSKGEKEDAMVVGGGGAGTGEGIGAGVRVGGNGGMDDLTVARLCDGSPISRSICGVSCIN